MDLIGIGKLNRESARMLHSIMWLEMARIAREDGLIPEKSKALNNLGYDPKLLNSECIICTWTSYHCNNHEDEASHNLRVRDKIEDAWSRCDWCPLSWSESSDTPTPCFNDDSPFNAYMMLKGQMQRGEITMNSASLAKIASICEEVANLPMLAVIDECETKSVNNQEISNDQYYGDACDFEIGHTYDEPVYTHTRRKKMPARRYNFVQRMIGRGYATIKKLLR